MDLLRSTTELPPPEHIDARAHLRVAAIFENLCRTLDTADIAPERQVSPPASTSQTQPNAATRFSLEDVFVGGNSDKLAWVSGWRMLPHVPREVLRLFEYPQPFAADVFDRVERALRRRVTGHEANATVHNGRLFIPACDDPRAHPSALGIPDVPAHYILSSDAQLVAAHKAVARDEQQLLHSRLEGEFIVSYRTSAGWVAISKDILTDVLGAGRDAKIVGLPSEAAHVVKWMCPELVELEGPARFGVNGPPNLPSGGDGVLAVTIVE
jgi:hypothetical protein